MPTSKPLPPHVRALLFAGLVSALAWIFPPIAVALLPLRYLNTHLHEICHAVAAITTGGQVQGIAVYANGSGVTPIAGGNLLLTASAGYLGASFLGAAILAVCKTESAARTVLRGMGILLLASTAIWVRSDSVGVFSGLGWSVLLLTLSFVLRGEPLLFAAQFVGLQQCLNAITSVLVLYRISTYGETQSDAGILQQVSGIPAAFWAFGWTGLSLMLIGFGLRESLRTARPKRPT
jgi:hypothetical protein